MSAREIGPDTSVSLLDAVDHLLNRGAVLVGETTLSLAGVDLVYVGLNLLVTSVQTLSESQALPSLVAPAAPRHNRQASPDDEPGATRPADRRFAPWPQSTVASDAV